MILASF